MEKNKNCQICENNTGVYICPECNVFYCSVSCYQSEKHIQCSEKFYSNWVKEELKNCRSDSEMKLKMLEILKSNQESICDNTLDSDDEESVPDLAARMSDVNLNDEEAIWEKLTPEEKKEFFSLVSSGSIMKILPEWEPWWKIKKSKTLIQECGKENFDWKSLCPSVPTDIPKLSSLTKLEPSPNVRFIVLNIIESYIFTVRWFKGTYTDLPVEAMSTFIALSAALRTSEVFVNIFEAHQAFKNDLSKCKWLKSSEFDSRAMQEDLSEIINGNDGCDVHFCTKAVFSDIKFVCDKAIIVLEESKSNHLKRFSGSPPKIKQLQMISRKMTYYLSWVVEQGCSLKNILKEFS